MSVRIDLAVNTAGAQASVQGVVDAFNRLRQAADAAAKAGNAAGGGDALKQQLRDIEKINAALASMRDVRDTGGRLSPTAGHLRQLERAEGGKPVTGADFLPRAQQAFGSNTRDLDRFVQNVGDKVLPGTAFAPPPTCPVATPPARQQHAEGAAAVDGVDAPEANGAARRVDYAEGADAGRAARRCSRPAHA